MTDKLKQIIKDEIAKLPKESQEAINSCEWMRISEEIGKKYLLNENQVSEFQAETSMVFLGLIDSVSYVSDIENNIGVTTEKAESIAKEAFEKIFAPINNTLTENIKKNLKNKKVNAEQNLDFILSGGDYGAFVTPSTLQGEGRGEVNSNPTPPSLADIQASLKNKLVI